MLPSVAWAQEDASEYFTVVLFGDPEVNLTDRAGNNATQENLTRWAEGIVNMKNNTNGYFNFQNQPAGFTPKADLVICMGDMDGDSETSGTAIKAVFKKFTDANIPFITMIGNHDVVPDRWNNGQVGATSADAIEDNLLKGTDESKSVSTDGMLYMLSRTTANGVGFYQASADGKSFNNGAHKAYLELSVENAQSGVRMILFSNIFNGTETGVVQSNADESKAEYYDLSGRRINGRPASGIYIVNGKKQGSKC